MRPASIGGDTSMLATLDMPTPVSIYASPIETYLATPVASVGLITQSYDKWRRVILALEPLRRLRDNWDGLGAAAPSVAMVDSAIDLASSLDQADQRAPTSVAPTPAGTILFTWDDAEYLEIEIRSPYYAEWMRIGENGSVKHGELTAG